MVKTSICCALAFLFGAVTAFAQKDTTVTPHGHRLVNHTRLAGVHPKPGDYVLIGVNTFVGDSLMGSTATAGGPREWQLPLETNLPKRVPSIYDAMLLMAKGDSVTLLQTIDSLLRRSVPASLRAEKDVRYEIFLVDFYDQAEKDRRMSALQAEMQGKLAEVSAQTQALAKDFAKGKLKGKLLKTASGLQYIVHDPGPGAPLVKGEQVSVHYYGCLTNGTPFDNSFERGEALSFALGMGQMIAGFDEGAALLRHGGKATLFLPSRLGYGAQANGDIPANSELVFYIEIQ